MVEGDEEGCHGLAERSVLMAAECLHGAHGRLTLPIAEKQAESALWDRCVLPGRSCDLESLMA